VGIGIGGLGLLDWWDCWTGTVGFVTSIKSRCCSFEVGVQVFFVFVFVSPGVVVIVDVDCFLTTYCRCGEGGLWNYLPTYYRCADVEYAERVTR
jgi:hypothetical protein